MVGVLMRDQNRIQPGRIQAALAHPPVDCAGGAARVDQDGGGRVGNINGVAAAAAAEDADGQAGFDSFGMVRRVQFSSFLRMPAVGWPVISS